MLNSRFLFIALGLIFINVSFAGDESVIGACDIWPELTLRLDSLRTEWDPNLSSLPGFSPPGKIVVCKLSNKLPYADRLSNRIFLNDYSSVNDQISLAHEYLHLAFGTNPVSYDEDFIEDTAKKLVL